MKRSLRTLQQLQFTLAHGDDGEEGGAEGRDQRGRTLEQRRAEEAAKQQRLAKLSPYKQAEYRCLECIAELRKALGDVEELQNRRNGGAAAKQGGTLSSSLLASLKGFTVDKSDGARDEEDGGGADEREGLLAHDAEVQHQQRYDPYPNCRGTGDGASSSTNTALLEYELARSRQLARRSYQQLQQLQREATRQAALAGEALPYAASSSPSSSDAAAPATAAAAAEVLDWSRAQQHIERAKRWYRDVFSIRVVSSLDESGLRLQRPAQPQQGAGSMMYFGNGANAVPSVLTSTSATAPPLQWASPNAKAGVVPSDENGDGWFTPQEGSTARADDAGATTPSSLFTTVVPPQLVLRSAREEAEFQEFFKAVQGNDELIDAAVDRLSAGVGRLLNSARGIENELNHQEALLRETEVGVAANEVQLVSMNRRLGRAMRELDGTSLCTYVACLLVLLLLLSVLLRLAG